MIRGKALLVTSVIMVLFAGIMYCCRTLNAGIYDAVLAIFAFYGFIVAGVRFDKWLEKEIIPNRDENYSYENMFGGNPPESGSWEEE